MPRNETATPYDQKPGQPIEATENVHRLARAPRLDGASDEPIKAEGPPPEQSEQARRASPAAPVFEADKPAKDAKQKAGTSIRTYLFALLPLVLAVGGYFYVTGGAVMTTENAYVQADMVGVANDISGIVSTIAVTENQRVSAGDVLFKLDDKPFQLALDRANAQLGTTRNDLLAAQANYSNMQAQIEQAQSDIVLYDATFKRQQQLAANNFTPQSSFDDARHNQQVAQQKLEGLKAQLAGLSATLNGAPDAAVETYPKYKDMLAARDEAARQLDHTTVRAPISGIATKVPSLQPGQYLAASTSSIAIVATDHVWVQASPKETELTYVKPGQKVMVDVDTYPGIEWEGTVESISPASASSFSLLPAENSSGNWVKVVQRIPMRVRIDNVAGKPQLRAGMSVELSVETGHPRGLPEPLARLFGGAERSNG